MNGWKYVVTAMLLVTSLGALSGCSSAAPSISTSGANPIGTGATTSQVTGPTGGTLTLEGTTLTVPAGALDGNQMLSITSTTETPPSGVTSLSPVYQFGPAGLTFKVPVTVTLAFGATAAHPIIVWSTSDGTGFSTIATTVSGDMAAGQVTHFSEGFVADDSTVGALPTGSNDAGTSTGPADASTGTSAIDATADAFVPVDDSGSGRTGVASDSGATIADAALLSDAGTVTGTDGGSGTASDAGGALCAYCALGICEANCPSGTTACGSGNPSQCTDLSSDPANCGNCGVVCPSGGCVAGQCVATCYGATNAGSASGGPPLSDGGVNCSYFQGSTACGSACVLLNSDNGNCGSCGNVCGTGQSCQSGTCTPLCPGQASCSATGLCVNACPTGQAVCTTPSGNGTPICADLQTSASNCGACGNACVQGQICVGGACADTCGGSRTASGCGGPPLSDGGVNCSYCNGFTACGNACVDLVNDPNNCGGCGVACGAGQMCTQGACSPLCSNQRVCAGDVCAASCPSGSVVCDSVATGGTATCMNLLNDPRNCGACGTVCGQNEVCSGGSCVGACFGNGAVDASTGPTVDGGSASSGGSSGSFSGGSGSSSGSSGSSSGSSGSSSGTLVTDGG